MSEGYEIEFDIDCTPQEVPYVMGLLHMIIQHAEAVYFEEPPEFPMFPGMVPGMTALPRQQRAMPQHRPMPQPQRSHNEDQN